MPQGTWVPLAWLWIQTLGLLCRPKQLRTKLGKQRGFFLFTLAWPQFSPTHSKRVLREDFSLKRELGPGLQEEQRWELGLGAWDLLLVSVTQGEE